MTEFNLSERIQTREIDDGEEETYSEEMIYKRDVKEFIRLLKDRIHNIYGQTFEDDFCAEILDSLLGDKLI
jgi:hypothetical protein